jgi:hypothetical protein
VECVYSPVTCTEFLVRDNFLEIIMDWARDLSAKTEVLQVFGVVNFQCFRTSLVAIGNNVTFSRAPALGMICTGG